MTSGLSVRFSKHHFVESNCGLVAPAVSTGHINPHNLSSDLPSQCLSRDTHVG